MPGERVLLLHRGGDPQQPGGEHHRPARVAAHAHHHVRPLRRRMRTDCRNAQRQQQQVEERPQEPLPLEPLHLDRARAGSPASGTTRASRPRAVPTKTTSFAGWRVDHLLGERDAGEDVPPGAAAGDQHPHAASPVPGALSRGAPPMGAPTRTAAGGRAQESAPSALTESSTPQAPSSMMSELPP